MRRECLDHVIVFSTPGLQRLMKLYCAYYEHSRTHLSLNKDAPIPRPIAAPGEGRVVAIPQVGGFIIGTNDRRLDPKLPSHPSTRPKQLTIATGPVGERSRFWKREPAPFVHPNRQWLPQTRRQPRIRRDRVFGRHRYAHLSPAYLSAEVGLLDPPVLPPSTERAIKGNVARRQYRSERKWWNCRRELAPQVGFEPTTLRLTAGCSAIELLRNTGRDVSSGRPFSVARPSAGAQAEVIHASDKGETDGQDTGISNASRPGKKRGTRVKSNPNHLRGDLFA